MAVITVISLDDSLSDQWTAAGRTEADLRDNDQQIQDNNERAHQDNLGILQGSPYEFIRRRVASNSLISVDLLWLLLRDRDLSVYEAAGSNPRTGGNQREAIYHETLRQTNTVLVAMASFNNLRQIDQDYLASPLRDYQVRLTLTTNTNLSAETLIKLCQNQTVAMAANIATRAAAITDSQVRADVVFANNATQNPHLPNPSA